MSQAQIGPYPQAYVPAQQPLMVMPVPRHNGLGVFAFLLALIGLFIPTGIVSILALVLGLVAIGRGPRGFATFAVILGLLGSAFWLLVMGGLFVAVVIALVAALVAALGASVVGAGAFMFTQPEVVEVSADMANIAIAAQSHVEQKGEMFEDLDSLGLGVATLTDPWGSPYQFELTDSEPGFDIVSGGADGVFDTDDDIRLTGLDRIWEEAFETFGREMEMIGQKLEQLEECHAYRATCVEIDDDWDWDWESSYKREALSGLAEEDAPGSLLLVHPPLRQPDGDYVIEAVGNESEG